MLYVKALKCAAALQYNVFKRDYLLVHCWHAVISWSAITLIPEETLINYFFSSRTKSINMQALSSSNKKYNQIMPTHPHVYKMLSENTTKVLLWQKLLNDLRGKRWLLCALLTKLDQNTASNSNYRLFASLDIWYNQRRSKKGHNKQRSSEQKPELSDGDLHGIDVSAHIRWQDVRREYGPQVERKEKEIHNNDVIFCPKL